MCMPVCMYRGPPHTREYLYSRIALCSSTPMRGRPCIPYLRDSFVEEVFICEATVAGEH